MKSRNGIVAGKKSQLRVVTGSLFLIQSPETIEKTPCPLPRSHADFQDINLRRQEFLAFDLSELLPKLGHGIGNGLDVVAIGLAAGKRLLISFARRGLPNRQVLPEQRVERPDNARTRRR